MSESGYVRRLGDRSDGRLLRSLNGFSKFMPFIMPTRNDACNHYEQSFEITEADRWFRQQRVAGYKGMGMLHLIVAAYVRAIAELPAVNRFVVGRRIYAHTSIEVGMVVKRDILIDSDETTIKITFDPADTVFNVYDKINAGVAAIKASDGTNGTEDFANVFARLPRFVIRFAISVLRAMDYFGIIPKQWLDVSPFHGSMFITDLGSLGIGPVFHHIYNFGTLPVFIAFGAKRRAYELGKDGEAVERKYIDVKFTVDDRIVDGLYYASVFKLVKRYIADPTLLEKPPETVNRDID